MSKNIYFISDLHISHPAIIKYCNRPFSSVTEMNNTIINNINKTVKESDVLYILGDVCLGTSKDVKNFLDRLICKNIIVTQGNHCRNGLNHYPVLLQRAVLKIANKPILLTHHPYKAPWYKWNKPKDQNKRPKDYGYWHLHGHVHAPYAVKVKNKEINLNCELWNYTPVSIKQIEAIIQKADNDKIKNSLKVKLLRFHKKLKKYLKHMFQ